jgi:4-diphosphocytidyl-2-C-methyl-D-erythritol kinase
MAKLELKAYAKINLSLDVLGKMENGYHELRMIMQTVDLYDIVTLDTRPEGISIECGGSRIPADKTNIAWKAAATMMEQFGISEGVNIGIQKRIPIAAGLAGGSSDAAAVLRGMNQLFSLNLNAEELCQVGKMVGADVPYCVRGGTMLAEGIGEILTELPDFSGVELVLLKPKVGVSTAWVYGNLKLSEVPDGSRPGTEHLIQALEQKDLRYIARNMKNVLEGVTIPKYEVVQQAKDKLLAMGSAGSMMSGSGPTVFGIFEDRAAADEAARKLSIDGRWYCYRTRSILPGYNRLTPQKNAFENPDRK